MTSYKTAQLIADSGLADKVVFLMDRIELGTQSLLQYQNFADETTEVQATDNTRQLVSKLKSDKTNEVLIVTSIQKASNIAEDGHSQELFSLVLQELQYMMKTLRK